MSPPDPERASLPTLTWAPIIDHDDAMSQLPDAVVTPTAMPTASPMAAPVPPPPPPLPVESSRLTSQPAGPPIQGTLGGPTADVGSISMNLNLGDVGAPLAHSVVSDPSQPLPPSRSASPPPPAPVLSAPTSSAAPTIAPPAEVRLAVTPLSFDIVESESPATPYQPIQPVGDLMLPLIREATPVRPYVADDLPAVIGSVETVLTPDVAGVTTTVPTTAAATLPTLGPTAAPLVPGTQPAVINLPPAPAQPSVRPAPIVSPLAVEVPKRGKPTKRRARSGLRLILVLMILAGIVGSAIVFGRPYLFPDDWEANAKPSATAVEDVTGQEFVEPVTVTAESSDAFQRRATAQLLGDWTPQVATWRALGLVSGEPTNDTLSPLLKGWAPALYSTTDGQIYHDDASTGSTLQAELTQAMAKALLDQRFGWAVGQSERTLDAAALVEAEVLAQSQAIQLTSEFNTPLDAAATAPLAYLPAVLSYQVLAPAMYSDLLAPIDPPAPNPLEALADGGSGPLPADVLTNASTPALADGDVITGSPAAMDRSFWYLVLAGYLDAPTAYTASEAIVESSLTVAQRSGTTCVYSTFSGGDLIQTETLRTALEAWVLALPAEFTASASVLADGGVQVVSCDPGAQLAGTARLGVARELVGWRSAEIATIEGVRAAGGADAEIAAALDRLAMTDVGAQLATSSLSLTRSESAEVVRGAVKDVVTPPAPPVVEVTE